MQTLDSPVYEVKQNSDWYQKEFNRRENQKKFFETIKNDFITDNGFAFYNAYAFGIYETSNDYETYKDELVKNPDKNGIHLFKKRSKHYKIFSEMLKSSEKDDWFKPHDVLGSNNIKASQWIGNRWFFSVRNKDRVPKESINDEIESVDFKEYLKVISENLD